MIYVLIIMTYVYGGQAVSFQEFNSKQKCEEVSKFIYDSSRFGGLLVAKCVEK